MSAAEAMEQALADSGLDDMTDPADIVDALHRSGYAVVELPKVREQAGRWMRFDDLVAYYRSGEYNESISNGNGEWLTPAGARARAAALLAAADTAEAAS